MTSPFIIDEDFEGFLEDFGDPLNQVPCSAEVIAKYKNKLPRRLLEYWQEYGFCSFEHGRFWIVNPNEYEDTLAKWLENTDIPENDVYHVFARNAFGDLFLWGEQTGYKYKISASQGWIIEKKGKDRQEHNIAIEWFFGSARPKSHDLNDEEGKPLFERCVRKFGALKADEVFGFVPSLIAGGGSKLDNINKLNIFAHLSILAQFGQIEVLNKDALFKKLFG